MKTLAAAVLGGGTMGTALADAIVSAAGLAEAAILRQLDAG